MTTDEIRGAFLGFFSSKDHHVVPSDSLVPAGDPTLLFTGAGMNQFKDQFLGKHITYRRAASCQKCLRTADLENVGRTSGHHTFFEMLGNFSFGGYFKEEAIRWAWEFMTEVLAIDRKVLWVSVYRDDDEAYAIWLKDIGVSAEKIVRLGPKENFWPSNAPADGPNGPCGPCSEIFYDWGPKAGCGKPSCDPSCDCGRFVEVWNLVFTQFDRQPDGSLAKLANRNIDTGMGLERIAAVMQGKRTNFEIDIFRPIVEEIKRSVASNQKPVPPSASPLAGSRQAQSAPGGITSPPWHERNAGQGNQKINAIADHIRAVTFAIADGVRPSNEERGYVVRKLIRRSRTYGAAIGLKEPFLYKLVSVIVEVMKRPYPRLVECREDIAQVVKKEEELFSIMMTTVLPKVEEAFERFSKEGVRDGVALAKAAFTFYDTHGMPYDWIEEIARKWKLVIDRPAFEQLLDKQREQSRSKSKIRSEIFSETFEQKVESLGLKTEFLGYERFDAEATVATVLENGEVILDKTPFYGESGGQVGDWGKIETDSGTMEVEDAKKIGQTIVHIGRMLSGTIRKGERARVSIDDQTRKKIMLNHTATHLLQAALRKVLGPHVRQTGSLVDRDHLRFDFTHMQKVNEREITLIEEAVNDAIKRALPVKKEIRSIAAAKKEGAIALFDEKYGDSVRVVTVGDVSKELCGGTHADNTREIGTFKITRESAIATGTRRIEAVTSSAAIDFMAKDLQALSDAYRAKKEKLLDLSAAEEGTVRMIERPIRDIIGKPAIGQISIEVYRNYRDNLTSAIEVIEKLYAKTSKELEKMSVDERSKDIDHYVEHARVTAGARIIAQKIAGVDMGVLRSLADMIRSKAPSSVIVLGSSGDGKVSLIAAVTSDVVKKGVRADALIKEIAPLVGGSGGGRPDFAQAGGKDPKGLDEALLKVFEIANRELTR